MDHDSGRPASMLRAILWSLVCCATACTGREVPSATSGTAVRQETWSEPENVNSLNSTYNDMYAVLTRDELVVYFTSDRPGGLGGVAAGADLEHVVGRRHPQLGEEDLGHQPVVVLARVDDRVPALGMARPQGADHRGGLDEIRSRSDDVEDAHRGASVPTGGAQEWCNRF